MKSYNPFRIIKELESGKLQSYPIGIQEAVWAIVIYFIFGAFSQRIILNTILPNQISSIVLVLIVNTVDLMCLLIVCRELFFFDDDEGLTQNNKLSIKTYVYTLLIAIGLAALSNVVSVLMIRFLDMSAYTEAIRSILTKNYVFAMLYICVIGPFAEELIYRGVLLGGLLKKYKPIISILIATALFSIMHGYMPQIIQALILGATLGVLYTRYRSVVLCFIVHSVHNFIAIIITSKDKYLAILNEQNIIAASLVSILGLILIMLMFKLLSKENNKVKDLIRGI